MSVNDIGLIILDGAGFTFETAVGSREIRTTVATQEYLWASVHAHLVLYNEYCLAQGRGDFKFDARESPRGRAALDLLEWAETNLGAGGTACWPDTLPRPVEDPPNGSDIHAANEVYLCGAAWIIHHELAHIRLGHGAMYVVGSVSEERDADVEATRFILSRSQVESESRKRTVGIASAILALQGLEASTAFGGQRPTLRHLSGLTTACLSQEFLTTTRYTRSVL